MSLKEKGMVVNLSISQWAARKYDAKASKEVEDSHNAINAGRFNKSLINRDTVLKEIGKVANAARTYHYENTLPWDDNGPRFLPVQNIFNYTSQMGTFQNQFETLINKLVADFPTLVEEARSMLNTLFREEDYPPVSILKNKFKFSYHFDALGDADDVRIKINDEEIAKIKEGISARLNDKVKNAVDHMVDRMRAAVSHMAETLKDPEKKFKNSLVGNICELVDLIPLLNFNDDPHVKDVAVMLKPLCISDIDVLRTNVVLRQQYAEKAAKILAKI